MANFCGYCGARLDPATGLCPNCEPRPTTIPETTKTDEVSEIQKTPQTDKKGGKSKIIIPVVAAAIIVLTAITVILLIHSNVISPSKETESGSEYASGSEAAVLSPETAVELFMQNKHVWLRGEYADTDDDADDAYDSGKNTHYSFIDIDFDGTLELEISYKSDGGGIRSIYKINLNDNTVERLNRYAHADVGFENIDILYKNNGDNSMFYIGKNEGTPDYDGAYSIGYGIIKYRDHTVYEYTDYGIYHQKDGIIYSGTDPESGEDCQETEQQYKQRVEKFKAENTDLHLSRSFVSHDVLTGKTTGLQEGEVSTLLEAYKSFRYDGFSFDDNKSNNVKHKEIPETTTEITTVQPETTTVQPETTTKLEIPEKPTVDYAKLYANLLKSRLNDSGIASMTFTLVYIDRDEIPELLISTGTSHFNGVDIYTIRNGKCAKVGDAGPYGGLRYVPYGSMVESKYSGMGATILTYSRMTANGLDTVQEFQASEDVPLPGKHFYINNNEVSEEQYNASYKAYISKYSFTTFENENGSPINSDNISKLRSDPTRFIL